MQLQTAKRDWQKKFAIPCVIGALDCTHIRITKPSVNGDDSVNRKQYPSINVQATCDALERFTSVNAKWPGSVHDSRIWKNSLECGFMQTTSDCILIADSGYGIAPWLITPYENPQEPVETHFNNIYAKDRVIIERCFGQVKRRFPTLQYKVRAKLESVSTIIVCCFVLHNVAKYLSDPEDFPEECDFEDPEESNEASINIELGTARIRNLGQLRRKELAEIVFRNRN